MSGRHMDEDALHQSEEEEEEEDEEEEERAAPRLPPRTKSPARSASPDSIRRAVEARASAAAPAASPPKGPDPAVAEARKEFFRYMDDQLLDYKHNHPINVANCASTLLKIFNNVLEHPEEQKFRQVKASGNAFRGNVSNIKGGEKLMTLAGWRVQVMNLEKYYVFEAPPGSLKMDILRECSNTLNKALATVNEKAEKKRQEIEAAGAKEKARKEQILRQMEDDKQDRKLRAGAA